jgi:hypothetical protein
MLAWVASGQIAYAQLILRGVVRDAASRPVAEARIQVMTVAGEPLGVAVSDASGRWQATVSEGTRVVIEVAAPGIRPGDRPRTWPQGPTPWSQLHWTSHRSPSTWW